MQERLFNLWMYIVCPRCGRIRNPFKGYYQLCDRCEKEMGWQKEKQMKKLRKDIIRVGDELKFNGKLHVVTKVHKQGNVSCILSDGQWVDLLVENVFIYKTGRNYPQMRKILKKLGEGEAE